MYLLWVAGYDGRTGKMFGFRDFIISIYNIFYNTYFIFSLQSRIGSAFLSFSLLWVNRYSTEETRSHSALRLAAFCMEPPTCGWQNCQGSLWTLVWMHTVQLENISRLFTLCIFFSVKLYRWGIGRLREGRGLAGCLASDLLYFSVCWSKLLNRWRLSTPPHCSRSWNITYCPEFINTLQAALCVHSTVLTTVSVAHTEVGHDSRGLYQIKDWNSQKKKKKALRS